MSAINKQRNILDFTLSSLLRRKTKNGALLVVYTLIVFLLASVMLFAQALKTEASAVLSAAPELVIQRIVAGRHDLIPVSYADRIREINGVRSVRARLWGYYYDPLFGANYTMMVPDNFTPGAGNVSVGPGLARSSMASVGNIFPLRTHEGKMVSLTVAEIMPPTTELVSADLVLMAEEDYRMLFGIPPDMATDLVIEVANPAEVTTIARKIDLLLPNTRQVTREDILRTYDAVFSWRSGVMLAIFTGTVLAFLIFAWDKATGLSAEERREIGILKAVGWDTGDVLAMKLWEGVTVSLTAFLSGLVLAYLHVFYSSVFLFAPILKGWSVLYPQFRLAPAVDFSQIAVLFFLSVVPYTAAILLPAWRSATIDPDSVMRG
jgi:ABC-type lipoprotein release transport system permease subunit